MKTEIKGCLICMSVALLIPVTALAQVNDSNRVVEQHMYGTKAKVNQQKANQPQQKKNRFSDIKMHKKEDPYGNIKMHKKKNPYGDIKMHKKEGVKMGKPKSYGNKKSSKVTPE